MDLTLLIRTATEANVKIIRSLALECLGTHFLNGKSSGLILEPMEADRGAPGGVTGESATTAERSLRPTACSLRTIATDWWSSPRRAI